MKNKYIKLPIIFILILSILLTLGCSRIIKNGDEQSSAPTSDSAAPVWNENNSTTNNTPSNPSPEEPTLPDEAVKPDGPLLRDEPDHQPTVILDAGHGFGDVGCAGPQTSLGSYEYELTMDMVNTLKTEMEAAGIKVLLTHDGVSFPSIDELIALCEQYDVYYDPTKDNWTDNNIFSPYERVIYMNVLDAMYGADFAFSVHVNANAQSDQLNGFDLDYCAENYWSEQSKVYAEALRYDLSAAYSGRNLWYYEDSWDEAFIVTKYNSMPSALLETGYYTNPEDCELLKDKAWRDTLMKNTAKTISEVLTNEYEKR